jgi:thymidylate kinase
MSRKLTIALIGGDGAGKTTIARRLMQSSQLPMKYVYMGFSTRSSNFALPTSQLVLFLKRRSYKRTAQKTNQISHEDIPVNSLEYEETKHGLLWSAARFLNRLAEAWFRQLISMRYQGQGYIVLYDRHFLFDAAPEVINSLVQKQPFFDHLYYWVLSHWYPKPDMVIFLDAPAELLYARKGEATPEFLNQQRDSYLEQGKKMRNFVQVDAAQPIDKVFQDVIRHVLEIADSKRIPLPEGID